jgi:chemotaxis methyl-accepting protein methylase
MHKHSKEKTEKAVQDQLTPVIEVMGRIHKLDVSVFDEAFLSGAVSRRQERTTVRTVKEYGKILAENPIEAETLFQSLWVTYSEFFRNPLTFGLLEQLILPGLFETLEKTGRKELRFWSAGCAAGQEVYSLTILLDELEKSRNRLIPCRIFATDISLLELAQAQKGLYNRSVLGNVRLRQLAEYLSGKGETYTLIPRLREKVDFSVYDLLDAKTTCPPACIFGDFDLVFCSNVLIYYRPETQQAMLDKMKRCLRSGGFLIVGEAERQIVVRAGGFKPVVSGGEVFKWIG